MPGVETRYPHVDCRAAPLSFPSSWRTLSRVAELEKRSLNLGGWLAGIGRHLLLVLWEATGRLRCIAADRWRTDDRQVWVERGLSPRYPAPAAGAARPPSKPSLPPFPAVLLTTVRGFPGAFGLPPFHPCLRRFMRQNSPGSLDAQTRCTRCFAPSCLVPGQSPSMTQASQAKRPYQIVKSTHRLLPRFRLLTEGACLCSMVLRKKRGYLDYTSKSPPTVVGRHDYFVATTHSAARRPDRNAAWTVP
jgi:hypothetical protein